MPTLLDLQTKAAAIVKISITRKRMYSRMNTSIVGDVNNGIAITQSDLVNNPDIVYEGFAPMGGVVSVLITFPNTTQLNGSYTFPANVLFDQIVGIQKAIDDSLVKTYIDANLASVVATATANKAFIDKVINDTK